MSNLIHIVLESIGLGTVVTLALIFLKVFYETKIKRIGCDHVYRLTTIIASSDRQIVYMECTKCGDTKEIVLDTSEVRLAMVDKNSENP